MICLERICYYKLSEHPTLVAGFVYLLCTLCLYHNHDISCGCQMGWTATTFFVFTLVLNAINAREKSRELCGALTGGTVSMAIIHLSPYYYRHCILIMK